MENKHQNIISAQFPDLINSKEIVVLDIPDDYKYMDEELVTHLEDSVSFYLNH